MNLKDPRKSLLLTKPTTETPHGGGFRFAPDSLQYRTMLEWLQQGGTYDSNDSVRISDLKVYPEERVLLGPEKTQQLVAVARYSDGSVRDVTTLVQYSSNSPDTVQVDAKGKVQALQAGETAIMVRTMGKAVASRILVASGPTDSDYPTVAGVTYVDQHIFTKLRRLNIRPSEVTTDEQFLRRVYLDTIGLLPTQADTRRFLDAAAKDKRSKLIDELLQGENFPRSGR